MNCKYSTLCATHDQHVVSHLCLRKTSILDAERLHPGRLDQPNPTAADAQDLPAAIVQSDARVHPASVALEPERQKVSTAEEYKEEEEGSRVEEVEVGSKAEEEVVGSKAEEVERTAEEVGRTAEQPEEERVCLPEWAPKYMKTKSYFQSYRKSASSYYICTFI